MYYCNNCGEEFNEPKKIYETHNLSDAPFEVVYICPRCKSGNYREKITTHCRCCGARLTPDKVEYCSEPCRRKGKKLWKQEYKRKRKGLCNPILFMVRECNRYNKLHNTNYSYGQYVALIEPTLKRRNKNAKQKEKLS